MAATPFWFGPSDRPLFGWLHLPDGGAARGGVVLCPPLGIEAICVYFSYRTLAERLASSGIAVLRFDYDGTGDSFGAQEDGGRTEAWLASVEAAVDVLRATGVGSVGLVGIRMGALLAATVAVRAGDLDAVVLWDPCISGRSFLREQRAFRLVSIGGDDDGSAVDAPGMRFGAETVDVLGGLDLLGSKSLLAPRVLVLEDPQRPRSKRLRERLGESGVQWVEATGQEALLDPPRQTPPWAVIDLVRDWIAAVLDRPAVFVSAPPGGAAVVGRSASGDEIVEETLTLGPHGLFGIVTRPARPSAGPTMVFVDEGNTPHIGQSRLWVELARSWAASGLQVLRFDLSGNGDSAARPGQRSHVAVAVEAFEDVLDACRAISPGDPSDVVLIGLCSGAYQAIEHALAYPTRGVCAINPGLSFVPPPGDVARPARQRTRKAVVDLARRPINWGPGRRSPLVARRWLQALEAGTWPASLAARRPWVPEAVWAAVNRLLLDNPAASTFERMVASGTDVILVCGPPDLAPLKLGGHRAFRRLGQSPRFHLELIDGLDHAGLMIEGRQKLKDAMTVQIVGRYAGSPPGAVVGLAGAGAS
jgi:alpha-beta hydrolase superfamily lysophospholipase